MSKPDGSLEHPVVFIIFNRPEETKLSLAKIVEAKPSKIYVIADGPRDKVKGESEICAATRALVDQLPEDIEVTKIFADKNLGLRKRIQSGLDEVFSKEETAIILEDDCLPSSSFFEFCSAMLNRYATDDRVMQICGTNYIDDKNIISDGDYYFSKYALIWGWATWARAWKLYDHEMVKWPKFKDNSRLDDICEGPSEKSYWTDIFDNTYQKIVQSWAFPWQLTCWYNNGLIVSPTQNLVENIGIGEQSTNTKWAEDSIKIPAAEFKFSRAPSFVLANRKADHHTFEIYYGERKRREDAKFVNKIRRMLALRTRLKKLLGSN